ncbi:hypothetical protein WR25_06839 [Diploscapter pachys]|uniref:Flavin-containing monooxygenase n=1 Tax=Diploscapter pachys TaxID=2018661 RepID=A0A2A2JHR9_9BILA|nr:hypothetical protein WR25_06839 [Diploscapter pachys]
MVGKKRVLVVGAGPNGLPAIRWGKLYDVDVICFEASDKIGGLWRYKPTETDESSVMKSTVINTSKELCSYSDFPPEPEMANYMHNTEMLRYFQMYAEQYDLIKHIKFEHKVVNIERASNYETTGKWTVKYTDNNGEEKHDTFDGVLLCTGHHQFPNIPHFEGQEKFNGKITHSHSYKDHRGYEDKVIVCVGVGNSGVDVAVEMSRVGKQVYLSTRKGTWLFNRVYDYGLPMDQTINCRVMDFTRKIVPGSIINYVLERKLNQRFNHELYGLKPKHHLFSAHPTINDELPNRIISGTVRVKPDIKQFTETGVVFEDGSEVEHVDEVILSTGYKFHMNLLESGNVISLKNNRVGFYKYMFPPEFSDHNTFAVIGLMQTVGAIMPAGEMQIRLFYEAFSGGVKLPSREEMEKDVQKKIKANADRYVDSLRHTIQVDFVPFMDELAEMIGCDVKLWEIFKQDPSLAYKVFFGPNSSYIYRLRGPHPWEGAKQAIEGIMPRTLEDRDSPFLKKPSVSN